MKLTVCLLVLLLGVDYVHQVSGATHSWKAYFTSTTGLSEFPEFVALNELDNEEMAYFDSKTNRFVIKQSWMAGALGKDYEEQQSNALKAHAQHFKTNVRVAMERFNQTQGVHTFQSMHGCMWDDKSQAVNGFSQYGYDGEDFVTLDLENQRYIATTPQSTITKQKWDNDRYLVEGEKNFYLHTCIEWLKKYVQYGSSTLERKVHPEVTLLQKGSGVVCHATGFYPDGVMITLKRDGEEMQDVDVGETLPNEDGTFQKRAVLTVSPEMKKGQYTCEVAHKSGPPTFKTLIVEDGNILGIIIGCVAAAAVVIGVIVAIVMMKKKGYKKAEQSDSESDHSNGARA
ncbi:major histocompatibility complex class I-related protein 1-like [Alosa pseudoharengus]|uniref:major histocompatibility complex class I-related protein 1-like n=1 Tax=Alosa pseudoharengus TaxID=34774 RepID=UPI003F8CD7E0